jgi:hypothetical protein
MRKPTDTPAELVEPCGCAANARCGAQPPLHSSCPASPLGHDFPPPTAAHTRGAGGITCTPVREGRKADDVFRLQILYHCISCCFAPSVANLAIYAQVG